MLLINILRFHGNLTDKLRLEEDVSASKQEPNFYYLYIFLCNGNRT